MRPTLRSTVALALASTVAVGTCVVAPAAAGIGDLIPAPPGPPRPLTFTVSDAEVQEGDPGDANVLAFEIHSSHAVVGDVTLHAASGNLGFEATPGVDFSPIDEVVVMPGGATSTIVEVAVIGDDDLETDAEGSYELVVLHVDDPSAGSMTDGTALGRIHDDDMPEIDIDDLTQSEGTGGTTDFHFVLELDHPSTEVVSLDLWVAAGSATTPSDYSAAPVTVEFQPGETELEYVVSVVADDDDEANEQFAVQMGNADGGTIVGGGALGTIVDDDGSLQGPDAFTIIRWLRLIRSALLLVAG